jgi:hypothetical protein
MPKELPYTSSIKAMPLMFSEMKRTAMLLCEGKTGDEIVSLSVDANVYQLDKTKRRRDVPLRMIKRLSTIGEPLVSVIASSCESDAKLVAFLALMKADRLVFEYMVEVYMDRFHAGLGEITDKDFLWTSSSIKRRTVKLWRGGRQAILRLCGGKSKALYVKRVWRNAKAMAC